ncbi:hypothetical protein ACM66B_006861 [Microbotryomycetes sp. NB124-2]
MSRSHFSRLGCDASMIIEEWCSSSGPDEKCCGLCPYTGISGNGQIIFNFVSTALTCLSLMLAAEEAWMVSAMQAVTNAGQNMVIIIMMLVSQRMFNRYQVLLNYMFSMSWLPVMTACFFSPVWRQNGLNSVKVSLLQVEFAQLRAENTIKRTRSGFNLWRARSEAATRDEREVKRIEGELFRGLRRKSAAYGTVWLVLQTVSVVWYALYVWSEGNYTYVELPCERELDSLKKLMTAMKIWSYVATFLGYVLCLLQICCPLLLRKGGAELYLDLVHPKIQSAHQKVFGRAEHRNSPTHQGIYQQGQPDPTAPASKRKLVRDFRETEKVQRWATGIMFTFWASGNLVVIIVSVQNFLLTLDDPWTFGQIPLLVYLAIFVLGAIKSYRERSLTQIALARLAEEHAERKGSSTETSSSGHAHVQRAEHQGLHEPLMAGHQDERNERVGRRSRRNSINGGGGSSGLEHHPEASNLARSLSSTRIARHQTYLSHRSLSRPGRAGREEMDVGSDENLS